MKAKRKSGIKKSAPTKKHRAVEVLNPEVLPAEKVLASGPKITLADEEIEELETIDSAEDLGQDSDELEPPEEELEPTSKELSTEVNETEIRAISPTDPLRRYFDEISRYPLIDAQHELELARRLRDLGDIHAAKALVQANLRLVVKIALEYRNLYSNVLDLIQEGNIGLMKAVSKFDPTKGARLGYYASWWIRSYILKYLLDNFRLVKVGTTQAQKKLFYHLVREKERLEAQGLLAGPKLLAEKLNVREKDVVEMEQRLSGRGAEVSLDAPVDGEDGGKSSHIEYLVDQSETADEALARNELIQLLKNRLPDFEKQLNDRELKLLHARLLAEEPKTLQEVANQYGLTRERARQIEAKVISKLREFLAENLK